VKLNIYFIGDGSTCPGQASIPVTRISASAGHWKSDPLWLLHPCFFGVLSTDEETYAGFFLY